VARPSRDVLVIAPHPDDEVLGAGGTIARAAREGDRVTVAIVTRGEPDMFAPELVEQARREARDAHALLGVAETRFLDFPAVRLSQVPPHELNAAIGALVRELRPRTLFTPFRGDVHLDHRLVFDAVMVAARPGPDWRLGELYAYETLSETNWNAGRGVTAPFLPDCFVDITAHLREKLDAMRCYRSQLREFPEERSIEALEALARHRGATVGLPAAEAFMTIRRVV